MDDAVRTFLVELATPPIVVFTTGTQLPTTPDPSAPIATLAPLVPKPPLSRNNAMALYVPLSSQPSDSHQRAEMNPYGIRNWKCNLEHPTLYLVGVILVFTNNECLQQTYKIGGTKPPIQRWTGFLSAYTSNQSYSRGEDKNKAESFSRLPLPPIEKDNSDSWDNFGVYFIRR